MLTVALIVAAWLAVGTAVALLIGRAVTLADRHHADQGVIAPPVAHRAAHRPAR